MTDGIFNSNINYARARAVEVMSTKSETDFEWSVKLLSDKGFEVGIASQFDQDQFIYGSDPNAILYSSDDENGYLTPSIAIGVRVIHTNLPEQKTGDVIRFRFEPQRKKFVIDLVRF